MKLYTREQALNKLMYNTNIEIDEFREVLRDYFNCDCTKEHLLAYANLKECGICGYVGLEEDMHENDDGIYCDVCWEAR